MHSWLKTVVALVLLASPAFALAQPRPYIYLWGSDDDLWTPDIQANASEAVRIQIVGDPVHGTSSTAAAYADKVVAQARAQIQAGKTDATKLAIIIHHFGEHYAKDLTQPCSFITVADAIVPEPLWENDEEDPPPDPPMMGSMQPWMGQGREDVAEWMQDFLDRYDQVRDDQNPVVPIPAFLAFDTETNLGSCCIVDFTRVLQGVAQDNRWDDEDPRYPVPGFDGDIMSEIYADACTAYGWDTPLENELDGGSGPDVAQNRPYFLWWHTVLQKALDGALAECAYEIVAAQDGWENCKCSNYGHTDTNGGIDDFGWYTGHQPGYPNTFDATRVCIRGVTEGYGGQGPRYIWDDYEGSLWYTLPGVASGDYSSPFL